MQIQIETAMIPQADVIAHVARVPEAVQHGATTAALVAAYLGAKGARQGLYYTQAARILGFIDNSDQPGSIVLTPYGRTFLSYDHTSQTRALRHLLLHCEPTRTVIAALIARSGMKRAELAALLMELAPLAESTARRRAQTIGLWLRDLNMGSWDNGMLIYHGPALRSDAAA